MNGLLQEASTAVSTSLGSGDSLSASAGFATLQQGSLGSQEAENFSHLAQDFDDYLSTFDQGDKIGASLNDSYLHIASFYEQLIEHNEFKMQDGLFRYASPVMIVIGNISNLMALVVLRRKKLRRNSVCFYMCAYAVANLCYLDFMLGVAWMCYVFNKPYVNYLADWTCRLWTFINNMMTYSGIWFVVAMNIDRLVHLTSRSNAQSHCTVFSAKVVVTAIMTGMVVVSIHAMWIYELQIQGCYVAEAEDFNTIIWPWWSATVYSYLPFFLLFSLLTAQIIVLCLKHFREPRSSPTTDGNDSFVVTVMVVSLCFLLLVVPATVLNIMDIHLPSTWLSVDFVARLELSKKIAEAFSSLNRAIFVFQLLVCSKLFRQEFAALFRLVCCCFFSRRSFKVFEMRQTSNSEDSSPHRQVDYELCNNNEEIITSV